MHQRAIEILSEKLGMAEANNALLRAQLEKALAEVRRLEEEAAKNGKNDEL